MAAALLASLRPGRRQVDRVMPPRSRQEPLSPVEGSVRHPATAIGAGREAGGSGLVGAAFNWTNRPVVPRPRTGTPHGPDPDDARPALRLAPPGHGPAKAPRGWAAERPGAGGGRGSSGKAPLMAAACSPPLAVEGIRRPPVIPRRRGAVRCLAEGVLCQVLRQPPPAVGELELLLHVENQQA